MGTVVIKSGYIISQQNHEVRVGRFCLCRASATAM